MKTLDIFGGKSNRRFASVACLACVALSPAAYAGITCTVAATGVTGIYTVTAALTLTGQFNINCNKVEDTLPIPAPSIYRLYLGVNQGETAVTGRAMLRQQTANSAANRLAHSIFRNAANTGSWTDGTGRAAGNTTAGGLLVTVNFGAGTTFNQTIPYYFRVAPNITGKVAGIYDDEQIRVQVRNVALTGTVTGTSGSLLASSLFTANASILARCYFLTTPTPMTMNYTAFSPAPVTAPPSNFGVNCTLSTPYTMALDATSGVLVGLNYSLALSATNAVGTGFTQNHSVSGSIAAGQAGTCGTGSCSGTQGRVVTITY
jgi:hypothetical protein